MRTRIKFCGLVRASDVDVAVALGVDAIGLVFHPGSPRHVDAEHAATLRRRLPSFVSAVGLFVDADPSVVRATASAAGLDAIQFHGDESAADCAAANMPYWKVIRMREGTDLLESARSFAAAECLLLDSFSEGFGGSGKKFDWSWIPRSVPARLILSGGLDAGSVDTAIRTVRPFAVDVSSGIQGASPREKDPARMERFVFAVLSADAGRA
jgi:phosphoribosylanthranilate isomerase